jgi:trigger factor
VTEPVERPAELGDVLVLDVNAFLNTGENPSDFLLADKDVALKLEAEADWPMPGFAPMVVGIRASEEKKFDLAFPEDYANESLRGQLAHLEVTCKEVKSRTLPEWTDDLAKEFGDYASLDDMRAKVRESLLRQAAREQDRDYSTLVMDKLLERTTIKYPPMLLEQELDSMMHDLDHRLKEQRLTLDDYLKIEGKTLDDLRGEYQPMADKRLKRSLALSRLIELEKIGVDEADVTQEIDRFTAIFGGSADAAAIRKSLDTPESRSSMALELLSNRALERLTALAKGEDIPLPAPEVTEAADAEAAPAPAATPVPEIEAAAESAL